MPKNPAPPGKLRRAEARCGVCRRVEGFGTRFPSTHMARRWIHSQGWRRADPWGEVCPFCLSSIPALRDPLTALDQLAADRKRERIQQTRDRWAAYMRDYRAQRAARARTTPAHVADTVAVFRRQLETMKPRE